jgi:hypothetical protein
MAKDMGIAIAIDMDTDRDNILEPSRKIQEEQELVNSYLLNILKMRLVIILECMLVWFILYVNQLNWFKKCP